MTEHIALAEIVDRCVEDITARRASVEDCLERWPEHRAELEPLLRAVTALASLPGIPEAAPAPERRAAFMAQLALIPQERPRRRLPRLNLPSLGLGAISMRLAAVAAPAAAIAAFALVLVLARGGIPASAAATLTVFAGGVEQQMLGEWYAAEDGMTLAEGVRLRTGADGRALLTFPDGSTTTLAPGTELALTRLQANGTRGITIEQLTGRLWHDVVSEPDAPASYIVRTPDAVVEARGTVFQTVIEAAVGETSVTTIQGLVDVVTTTERLTVAAGEVARAGAQRPAEVRAADVAGTVVVNASVSAALLASDGAATGSRSDGVVVRQIPGVGTSETEGGRAFSFSDAPEGVYTLWLTPTGDTADAATPSEVILQTPAGDVHIPLAAATGVASSLRVAVEVTDGRTVIRPLDNTPAQAEATPEVRVVDTERSRSDRNHRQSPATPTPTATATPTATPTGRDRGDDDRRDDDRRGGRNRNDTPVPAATVTATPAPVATPTFEVPERPRDFQRALERAIQRDDEVALRALLSAAAAAEGGDARELAAIVSDLGRRGAGRDAIREALTDGSLSGVRERLQQIADEMPRGNARERLRSLLDIPADDDGNERDRERDDRRGDIPTFLPGGWLIGGSR